MRVVIIGGFGFLGWHSACRLRAVHGIEPLRLGREQVANPAMLDNALAQADGVLHLAGVNRAETHHQVESGNVEVAQAVAGALGRLGRSLPIVFANSIQAEQDNPYGRGKRRAAEILADAVSAIDGRFVDVLLPNLFGEHGRPSYNSFVATFAYAIARDKTATVTGDHEVPLLHVQDAARVLIQALLSEASGHIRVDGESHRIGEVLDLLQLMHDCYRIGDVPPLTSQFQVDLFNTYRSYRFPDMFPLSPQTHVDQRGRLFETVRAHGGRGQAFISTTIPGATRGDHYHLRKVERFFVVSGEAEIRLRRLLHHDTITFRLSGDQPSYVDMPTLWVHNITNVGETELVTMFWSSQLLDPGNLDQYPEKVIQQ